MTIHWFIEGSIMLFSAMIIAYSFGRYLVVPIGDRLAAWFWDMPLWAIRGEDPNDR